MSLGYFILDIRVGGELETHVRALYHRRNCDARQDDKSHFDETDHTHSRRSATIGSTFAARRAGIQHASIATKVSSGGITINVIGSVALTPYSSPPIRRVTAKAAASPAATPTSVRIIPCFSAIRSTSPGRAPSAMRTPISRVRWLTECEITPYSPTTPSASPSKPNTPTSAAPTRTNSRAIPLKCVFIVLRS